MKDQLLESAGLAVFGSPGFEFILMVEEQLGQVTSVFSIILGAAGDEGLAEFLEGDGIDGVEGDPGVGLQEADQVGRRLFQTEGDTVMGMVLAQSSQPMVEFLGGSRHGLLLSGAGASVDELQIGLAIGTVQADDQVVGMGCGHGALGLR